MEQSLVIAYIALIEILLCIFFQAGIFTFICALVILPAGAVALQVRTKHLVLLSSEAVEFWLSYFVTVIGVYILLLSVYYFYEKLIRKNPTSRKS